MTDNQKIILTAGALVAIILFWKRKNITKEVIEMKNQITSRGIRNNNPGNIRKSSDKWQGLADPSDDGAFFIFTTPEYGIRAMARVLMNYYNKSKLTTIKGIINRWAPAKDGNNVDSYIFAVSNEMGKTATQKLNLQTDLPALVAAIIKHENGYNPYASETIGIGISMAYTS